MIVFPDEGRRLPLSHAILASALLIGAVLLAIDGVRAFRAMGPASGLDGIILFARGIGALALVGEAAVVRAVGRRYARGQAPSAVGVVLLRALLGAQAALFVWFSFWGDVPAAAPAYGHYVTALNWAVVPITWSDAPLVALGGGAAGAIVGFVLPRRAT